MENHTLKKKKLVPIKYSYKSPVPFKGNKPKCPVSRTLKCSIWYSLLKRGLSLGWDAQSRRSPSPGWPCTV